MDDPNVERPKLQSRARPISQENFEEIRRLAVLTETIVVKPAAHELTQWRNLLYKKLVLRRLQRTLDRLAHLEVISAEESRTEPPLQLAQILFLFTIHPTMSFSGACSQSVAETLRETLEQRIAENGSMFFCSPQLLCWLLFNGAITQQLLSARLWFRQRVVEFLKTTNAKHFDEIEVLLRKVCWSERFGKACRTFYNDLATTDMAQM
jgi:hypothetical protein